MDPTTTYTDPNGRALYASASGMVGYSSPGWLMIKPPIGETIRSAYEIPGQGFTDVAIQRTGQSTYRLSVDGGPVSEHKYAAEFEVNAPRFLPDGSPTAATSVPFTVSPGAIYYTPGPAAGGIGLTALAAAAAALFLLR
jgi:hypothetical protein